jgi:phage portal protein BeeE
VLIQEVLTAAVPQPQYVRFNTGALLRSDLQTRYASYATALAAGFLTVDEVRELEDRPPLADMKASPNA